MPMKKSDFSSDFHLLAFDHFRAEIVVVFVHASLDCRIELPR
jgi:hypothetical protein